jgi:hypothetical protein
MAKHRVHTEHETRGKLGTDRGGGGHQEGDVGVCLGGQALRPTRGQPLAQASLKAEITALGSWFYVEGE